MTVVWQVPTASVVAEGGVALNHCRWHSSGSNIAVGDDVGKIHIYDVAEVWNTIEEKLLPEFLPHLNFDNFF